MAKSPVHSFAADALERWGLRHVKIGVGPYALTLWTEDDGDCLRCFWPHPHRSTFGPYYLLGGLIGVVFPQFEEQWLVSRRECGWNPKVSGDPILFGRHVANTTYTNPAFALDVPGELLVDQAVDEVMGRVRQFPSTLEQFRKQVADGRLGTWTGRHFVFDRSRDVPAAKIAAFEAWSGVVLP